MTLPGPQTVFQPTRIPGVLLNVLIYRILRSPNNNNVTDISTTCGDARLTRGMTRLRDAHHGSLGVQFVHFARGAFYSRVSYSHAASVLLSGVAGNAANITGLAVSECNRVF